MKRKRLIVLLLVFLLTASSCYSVILYPTTDAPAEGEDDSVSQWKSSSEEGTAPETVAATPDIQSPPVGENPPIEEDPPFDDGTTSSPVPEVVPEETAAPEPPPMEEEPPFETEPAPPRESETIPGETEANEPEIAPAAETAVPEGSLSPFGAVSWRKEDGVYRYAFPARNSAGMTTLGEMDSFPNTRFEDANKPPDKDNWFQGKVFYDEATGEVTYYWDRWPSTLAALKKYGGIYRGDETRKVCYLTFDCGYEVGATGKILDALKEKEAPGTFFLTGHYVRSEYDLIKRMLDEGHVVGNHTNSHPDMTALSVDQAVDEMRQVEEDFKAQFPDAPDMMFFRPPSGAVNEWLLRLEAKLGYRTVMWSYTYYDYDVNNQWAYEDALNTLKTHLHPGCVYLLHAESSTNAEILPEFIDWIRSQGYEIEPICAIGA